jgi:PPOX class probable FMN-dependent enzyme
MDRLQNAEGFGSARRVLRRRISHGLLAANHSQSEDVTMMADLHQIATVEDLRRLFGHAGGLAAKKSLPVLDRHARDYIALSPFLCIATSGHRGRADVSPRGDQPGFVQVLDDRTIAIPDRPGNNRLDTMENIVINPSIGLIFMIPGFEDTLRINGKATITADPAILERATVDRKQPKVAIRVAVEEAFFHCAKAFRRSRLWQLDAQVDRKVMPTLARIILEQTAAAEAPPREDEVVACDIAIEEDYKTQLY